MAHSESYNWVTLYYDYYHVHHDENENFDAWHKAADKTSKQLPFLREK